MQIPLEDKVELLREVIDPILAGLRGFLPDDWLDGEDAIDFFALAIAAVIDHNERLVTPQQRRQAGEFGARRVQVHLKTLKAFRDEADEGLLGVMLSGRADARYRA